MMNGAWVAIACLLGGGAAWPQDGNPVVVVPDDDEETPLTLEYPFTLQLQGGIEGYSGHLAPRIDPGVTYGMSFAYEPFRFIGFELGYSGAENELVAGQSGVDDPNPGAPDMFRNGGYLIVTPGYSFKLPATQASYFKPYALGGIGLDRYQMHGITGQLGYSNATVANLPFGAGVKARVGHLSADARVNYAWEFNQRFSMFDDHPLRLQGQVLVGATF